MEKPSKHWIDTGVRTDFSQQARHLVAWNAWSENWNLRVPHYQDQNTTDKFCGLKTTGQKPQNSKANA
jgi:hypothetical protein